MAEAGLVSEEAIYRVNSDLLFKPHNIIIGLSTGSKESWSLSPRLPTGADARLEVAAPAAAAWPTTVLASLSLGTEGGGLSTVEPLASLFFLPRSGQLCEPLLPNSNPLTPNS